MNTENETTEVLPTLEETMKKVLTYLSTIEGYEANIVDLKQELSTYLNTVKAVTKSQQFTYAGVTWQIRNKKSTNFICKMTKKPGKKRKLPLIEEVVEVQDTTPVVVE